MPARFAHACSLTPHSPSGTRNRRKYESPAKRPPHFARNAASILRSWPSSFAWPTLKSPQQLPAAQIQTMSATGPSGQRHRWTRNFSGTSSLCLNQSRTSAISRVYLRTTDEIAGRCFCFATCGRPSGSGRGC